MDVIQENIAQGKYTNKLEFPDQNWKRNIPRLSSNQPSLGELETYKQRMEEYKNGEDIYSSKLAAYNKEQVRLKKLFEHDLADEHGLLDHPKRQLLWEKALDRGHSYGLGQVYEAYTDLAELLS